MLLDEIVLGFYPESAQDSPVQIDSVTFSQGATLFDVNDIEGMEYGNDSGGIACIMYQQPTHGLANGTFQRPDGTQYIIGGHPIHRPRLI